MDSPLRGGAPGRATVRMPASTHGPGHHDSPPPKTPKAGGAQHTSQWARNGTHRGPSRTVSGMDLTRGSEGGGGRNWEEELWQLQAQLDAETRRGVQLEGELRLAVGAGHKAEEAHQRELAAVEGDVKRLLAERRGLVGKLQTIEAVEDSVRELYVQMRDRLADDGWPTPEQLQAEKEALRSEHIMVVLGSLHASLKGLWAFKVEAEGSLKASAQARQAQHNDHVAALKAQVRELEGGIRRAHQDLAAANMRADAAEEALAAMGREAKAVAAGMAAQHQELLAALKAEQAETEAARRAAAAASEEGKARDSLVLNNRQLESARHFDRVAQDRELRELQVHHEVALAAMQRELLRVSDLMARNALLEEQLDRATAVATELRKGQQPSVVRDLERRVKVLTEELGDTRDRLSKALAANLDARVAAAALSASNAARPGSAPSGPHSHKDPNRDSNDGATTVASYGYGPTSRAVSRMPSQSAMSVRAAALMGTIRAAAVREARERTAEQSTDPVYNVLANMGVMHRAARVALKEVKKELAEGPAAARARADMSIVQPSAGLEATRLPRKGTQAVGAAGTNTCAQPKVTMRSP